LGILGSARSFECGDGGTVFKGVLRHIRRQPVAYVALFFALGGGALAATGAGTTDQFAGGVLSGRINGLAGDAFDADFGAASGTSTAGTSDDADRSTLSPAVDLVARELSINLTAEPGENASRTFSLWVNGAQTALSCVIAGDHHHTRCSDTSDAVPVPAGSTLSIEDATSSPGADPNAADARFGFRLSKPPGNAPSG
jgi:hypothetical protein